MKTMKIKFILTLYSLLLSSTFCYSQGKLIEKLISKNYKMFFCESFELLKKRVDTTRAVENKVVYSKSGNLLYGVIYYKETGSITYFHENVSSKKLYHYNINPFIDITWEPIAYDKIVSNLYMCYNVDFKRKQIAEYYVFFKVNATAVSLIKNDMITKSNIILKDPIPFPNFNDLKSIINYNLDVNKLKYKKKKLGTSSKIKDLRPRIFYFFVCLLEPSPTKCFDFNEGF